jgi:hemerythrin
VIRSWAEAYVTGNPTIDRQHRELLGQIDALEAAEHASAGSAVISILLEHVMELTVSHFLSEESLMARVGYPQHDQDEMIGQHRSVLPLGSLCREWLTTHEFGLDERLADFIRHKMESGRRTARGGDSLLSPAVRGQPSRPVAATPSSIEHDHGAGIRPPDEPRHLAGSSLPPVWERDALKAGHHPRRSSHVRRLSQMARLVLWDQGRLCASEGSTRREATRAAGLLLWPQLDLQG